MRAPASRRKGTHRQGWVLITAPIHVLQAATKPPLPPHFPRPCGPLPATIGRLGERLIAAGLITESQLDLALREQRRKSLPLGKVLVELGLVPPSGFPIFWPRPPSRGAFTSAS